MAMVTGIRDILRRKDQSMNPATDQICERLEKLLDLALDAYREGRPDDAVRLLREAADVADLLPRKEDHDG